MSEPVARGPRYGNIFSNPSIIYMLVVAHTMWNRMRAGSGQTKKVGPRARPGRVEKYGPRTTLLIAYQTNSVVRTPEVVNNCCAG